MSINQTALDLIKVSEGFVDHWYPDPGTFGEPWTCCYGHTSAAGLPVFAPGRKFTLAEGDAILQRDLANTEAVVRNLVKVPLNDNQYGALVSFVFNVGATAFKTSTLLRLLNAGDYLGAQTQFPRWVHGGGKVLPGLVTRRAAEMKLFDAPPGNAQTPRDPLPLPTTPAPPPPRSIPVTTAKPSWEGFLQAVVEFLIALFNRKV